MEALYLLVPLSVILVALALWIFFGAADSGQFDDLEGPAWRILGDDDRAAGAGTVERVGGARDTGS
ncbi:cbb3-type cytochrome oxidase assembly protein CcoS [Massilia consociata]|uniref:Cbb3-type cytochrome oxidase assembly protein CcoS n=1 Tax=Massilia consociata TaxID=760117 RepID=A0ABV6FA79_9BURK